MDNEQIPPSAKVLAVLLGTTAIAFVAAVAAIAINEKRKKQS